MADGHPAAHSLRTLVLAPTAMDASACMKILSNVAIDNLAVTNIQDLCDEILKGCGAVILTEESLEADRANRILTLVEAQPSWSDLPFLVLTRGGADSKMASLAMARFGNVVLLERPVRINSLVSATRTALRARQRQYQIQSQLMELEQFAYIASHDLQEPLRKISSVSDLLKMKYQTALGDEGNRYLGIITSGASRLSVLIRDLLSYTKINSGADRTPENTNLTELVTGALDDLDLHIQETHAKVVLGELPFVMVDSSRIHHVFLNLSLL